MSSPPNTAEAQASSGPNSAASDLASLDAKAHELLRRACVSIGKPAALARELMNYLELVQQMRIADDSGSGEEEEEEEEEGREEGGYYRTLPAIECIAPGHQIEQLWEYMLLNTEVCTPIEYIQRTRATAETSGRSGAAERARSQCVPWIRVKPNDITFPDRFSFIARHVNSIATPLLLSSKEMNAHLGCEGVALSG